MIKVKTALISVSDKTDILNILKCLKKFNIKILSSGGTFKKIKKLGFKSTEISNYTNSPEILSGRVKTLNPKIHGGILYDRNLNLHKREMNKFNYSGIDLVIVNFYPFEKVLESSNSEKKIIENIDIGGPTLVRSSAKNYKYVAVISSQKEYKELENELLKYKGHTSEAFRKKMAHEAFINTAYYDSKVSNYFSKLLNYKFPNKKIISATRVENLRYGENPHQEAAIYSLEDKKFINQIHGRKLSYNNYNDLISALSISKTLPKNIGTVIIKHANPCGVSIKEKDLESYKNALKCDPISAFGGVVSFNFKLKKNLAIEIIKNFYEIVIADGFEKSALQMLKKKKNLRIIDSSNFVPQNTEVFNSNLGGLLIQKSDDVPFLSKDFRIVSKLKPSKKDLKELLFAFHVCKFVKSNAIVICKDLSTIGIGSGQTSRLDSCEIAVNKVHKFKNNQNNESTYAASDAFFPFTDGIEKLVVSGVTSVIQPSGSIRDREIIKFADKSRISLIFSKTRHFKH